MPRSGSTSPRPSPPTQRRRSEARARAGASPAAVYYEEQSDADERAQLAVELGGRRDELCGYARAFQAAAPGAVEALRPRVAELVGVEPKVPVAFSAALQWTNANVRTWRGADILNLNARHESFRLVGDLVATVAHELIHDAQARLHDDESLPPVLRTLYREGAAVFGVSLLFPKMGDAALGMNARPAHSHPSMTKVHAGQNHWVLGTPVARFRPVQVPPSAGKSASEFEDVRCDIQPSGAISYRQLAGVVAW